MLLITAAVDVPEYMAQGVKESIAMTLERYGDTRITEIRGVSDAAQQTRMMSFDGASFGGESTGRRRRR